jgi:acyl carrier protein
VNSSELNKGNRVGKNLEQLLAELLEIPVTQITAELAMKDLDVWDSLKHMELIAVLEQEFDVQLTFDEIVTMRSVSDIKRVLSNKGVTV